MSAASDAYRKNMIDTQGIRQEYFNFQLPRILRVGSLPCHASHVALTTVQALQQCLNDVDLGTQYHLIRYAFLYEQAVLTDGTTLSPLNEGTSPAPPKSCFSRSDMSRTSRSGLEGHSRVNRQPGRLQDFHAELRVCSREQSSRATARRAAR